MYGLCIAHISSPAENRMRTRTAKGQRADALDELADPCTPAAPVPDADDEAPQRAGVLT
jgi:hypothetical protein